MKGPLICVGLVMGMALIAAYGPDPVPVKSVPVAPLTLGDLKDRSHYWDCGDRTMEATVANAESVRLWGWPCTLR